tara:strand:- start:530 stop:949 length:420 start_codon:yes stop_codon:yes gene_type:complete
MIQALLPSILPVVTDVVGRFLPEDKEKKAQAEREIRASLEENLAKVNLAQAQANIEQAKHPSIFVAGARPAIMWICAFALGWQFILAPISSWIIITWYPTVTLPMLETGELTSLVLALLGLGGMRTAEKWRGVARNSIK